jgi:hypothetical protein
MLCNQWKLLMLSVYVCIANSLFRWKFVKAHAEKLVQSQKLHHWFAVNYTKQPLGKSHHGRPAIWVPRAHGIQISWISEVRIQLSSPFGKLIWPSCDG